MAKRRVSRRIEQQRAETRKALRNIIIATAILAVPLFFFVKAMLGRVDLDDESLCPAQPTELNVLLVDVTDPMNVPQKQDFANQFDRLISQIPRYGELIIVKVDPVSDRLLEPIIVRCNPGSRADVSDTTGNPQKVELQHREQYEQPLKESFEHIARASGADRSPILESVQSVALTQFQKPGREGMPKRLIIASDLLQNTDDISFYGELPEGGALIASPAFRRVRTDLRGVRVELWMLERNDAQSTQPRALPELWQALIASQGGEVTRVYRVSG